MDEQKKLNEIDEAASALIENSESVSENTDVRSKERVSPAATPEKEGKFFKKYKIKDIVFLAIMTACTLTTGAVMPFVINVPVFGIVQLCLGLQFSIFPVIGMMKVRKPGSLFLQSIFIAVFLVWMFPPMAMICLCGLVAEGIAMLIFRGYKNDWACVVGGTLYLPMTVPVRILQVLPHRDGRRAKRVGGFPFGREPVVRRRDFLRGRGDMFRRVCHRHGGFPRTQKSRSA